VKSSNTIAKKNAQIKESQGESERGFVVSPGVTPDEINGKMMQKSKNQSKRSQVGTRFSPKSTQDEDKDKDKQTEHQDHDKEKKRKQAKDKDKEHRSQG
jgi:hypothetical protein